MSSPRCPKSAHLGAKKALVEIENVEERQHALAAGKALST
jgi:hypothetical protein